MLLPMIRSFGNGETERVVRGFRSRRLPPDIQQRAQRKLVQLDVAATLEDLRLPPSNHLEALKGTLAGFYSLRINQQWRIVFRWLEGDCEDVEIVDYH